MSYSKYLKLILQDIDTVLSSISDQHATQLSNLIFKADRIYIAGAGRSGLMMKAFAMRLMHMGFKLHVVGDATTPGINRDDLLLIGSGSGETDSLVCAAKKAKKHGAAVSVITAFPDSTIGELADLAVKITTSTPKAEKSGEYISKQPMGSCFEQSLLLFLDAMIMILMEKAGIDAQTMFTRHANLE